MKSTKMGSSKMTASMKTPAKTNAKTYNDKVAVSNGKGLGLKSQPPVGKLPASDKMQTMAGSTGKGQGVLTAPSNPIQGAPKRGTAMGDGGVIPGMI